MNSITTFIPEAMLMVFLASLFVIVLVTVLKILRELPAFSSKTSWLLALCISILCIVGMCQLLDIAGMSESMARQQVGANAILTYILLPYVVLSLAIILSQILLLTNRMLPDRKPDANSQDVKQPVKEVKPRTTTSKNTSVKTNQRGRPKKEQPTEKESKEATRTGREVAAKSEALS